MSTADIQIVAGWAGFFAGGLAGAVIGLFFHREDWLGGYGGWRRRMLRLGHVAFFGIGFLNLGFGLTARALRIEAGLAAPSALLLVGAAAMPAVCFLAAWRPAFRHLFFIPALSVIAGAGWFLTRLVTA